MLQRDPPVAAAVGVRTLVVSAHYAWPVRDGVGMRLNELVSTMADLGSVDLFALSDRAAHIKDVSDAPADRVLVHPRPASRMAGLGRLRWWLDDAPIPYARDYTQARRALAAWRKERYDLVCYSEDEATVLGGGRPDEPVLVDLHNLEEYKELQRVRHVLAGQRGARVVGAKAQAVVNARRHRATAAAAMSSADVVTVCSALDAQRLGGSNVRVAPNGFASDVPLPSVPLSRRAPLLVFPASFHYPPNLDGARWLIDEVLPLVVRTRPDVRLRLVGRHAGRVGEVPRGVEVVSDVPSMEPHLSAARVVVVPLRYGGGTRIKILEALAHRVPVVSTSAGAEGIGLQDGETGFLADDASAFAGSCVRLLDNAALSEQVAARGVSLLQRCYTWGPARGAWRSAAADAAGA